MAVLIRPRLRLVADPRQGLPPPLGAEPRYSEQDLADFRRDWQHDTDKRASEAQLSRFEGQLAGLKDNLRSIAREVVLEVFKEQRKEREQTTTANWTRREKIAAFIQTCTLIAIAILGAHSYFH